MLEVRAIQASRQAKAARLGQPERAVGKRDDAAKEIGGALDMQENVHILCV